MNLVGKILTVLICVMSLIFMALVVFVYAAHRNWREVVERPEKDAVNGKPLGLKFQLDKAHAEFRAAQESLEKLTNEITAERKDKRETLAKLESELDDLKKRDKDLDDKLAKQTQDARDATAAFTATQTNLTTRTNQLDALREEIRAKEKDRDDQQHRVVDLTDQLHQAVNSKMTLKKMNEELAQQFAQAKAVLGHYGLSISTPLDKTPPAVDGLVTAVRDDNKLVEITLGTDMGVLKGHQLEVVRSAGGVSTWLGRVEVIEAKVDRSVCKVLPEYRKGAIQRGDRVFSVPKLTTNN
jgi:predicted RNase H-like nuclease (RuvC/YqgF family)